MNDANFLQGIFTAEMIQITHWGFIFNLISYRVKCVEYRKIENQKWSKKAEILKKSKNRFLAVLALFGHFRSKFSKK